MRHANGDVCADAPGQPAAGCGCQPRFASNTHTAGEPGRDSDHNTLPGRLQPLATGHHCRENPSDPRCQGSTRAPALPATGARAQQVVAFFVGGVAAAAPGDPLCGQNPAPPPPAPPPTPTPIPVDAAVEAPRILAALSLPSVDVKANPALGLVNLPTWFWAVGYDGRPLTAAHSWSAPYVPTTVVVTLTVDHYTWNWGDGGQIDTESLGEAYPAESDIQNVYRWSSRSEPGGNFHGSLTVHWRASYTVNGAAPVPLSAVERRYEFVYPVQQIQPVIRPNGAP